MREVNCLALFDSLGDRKSGRIINVDMGQHGFLSELHNAKSSL